LILVRPLSLSLVYTLGKELATEGGTISSSPNPLMVKALRPSV
jgi:hypothetical protein